jgi:type III pantothenate kinase
MNLVIDLGNTSGKIAVIKDDKLIESAVYDEVTIKEITYFLTCYNDLKGAIFSSVVNHSRELVDFLGSTFDPFIELSSSTPLPIINHYQTPETLGYDRVAAVTGAHTIYPDHNVLVIDAGSAITYDVITAKGEYLGGNIAPGMGMRFKALHRFTSRLPMMEAEGNGTEFWGTTTEKAILSGVMNGVLFEIEGFIQEFSARFEQTRVVLTGGDAKSFEKKLKNSIFVVSHLNLIGLNRILEHNAKQDKRE